MSVGCDKKTSRAAAQTLAISAFFNGGDFVTFPLYPASSNLPIMLSTSSTCGPPAPAIEFRLIVWLKAVPTDRDEPGPGELDRFGDAGTAEGGGDVPMREERSPP